jgi:kinetochore protein Mis12/MTW1
MAHGETREDVRPPGAAQHDFSFLTSNPSARALNVTTSNSAHQPLKTNANFALSQLPALRSLLADLRPRLASLQTSTPRIDGARAERREERREYIEQRARMHLQRNGESSLVRDPAIAGKRIEPEQVEALEKVADIFDTH